MNVPVPPFVKLPTPLITPLYVVELLSLLPPVVNAADNVTFPAPAKDPIVCAKLFKFEMAPLETDISLPFPKLFAIPACNVPALTVVAPVYVLAPDNSNVPELFCVTPLLPLIIPLNVVVAVLVFVNNVLKVPLPLNVKLVDPLIEEAPVTLHVLPMFVPAEVVCNAPPLNVNVPPEPSALLLLTTNVPADKIAP